MTAPRRQVGIRAFGMPILHRLRLIFSVDFGVPFETGVKKIMPAKSRSIPPSGKSLILVFSTIALLQWGPLSALEPPSKPFLDKNSFYLSSAGFKVHFANDAASKQAMHALPAHRFVIHRISGGDVRYLYAEPLHCVCVFIGTKDAYQNYRDILSQPIQQPDNVSADYNSQVSSVLVGDPVDIVGYPPYAAEYFHNYY